MALSGRLLRRWRSESGAELIELALVIPILLLVCAAIVDFGFLFRSWETGVNAAREGARVGSLPGYGDADVLARIDLYMAAAGIDPAAYTREVTPETITAGAFTMSARSVTVTVTHDFVILSPIQTFWGGSVGSVDVTARAVMRTEAQAATGP